MGIKSGTFGFIEVKYKCPWFDPHFGMFLGSYEWLYFDNNKLFLFFKVIHYGQFIALSKIFLWINLPTNCDLLRKSKLNYRDGISHHSPWKIWPRNAHLGVFAKKGYLGAKNILWCRPPTKQNILNKKTYILFHMYMYCWGIKGLDKTQFME